MTEGMLDENYCHTQGSDLDSSIDTSNLTQRNSNFEYEFLESDDEDDNAFPFSPIFGKKYEKNIGNASSTQVLYGNVVAEPITSDDERLVLYLSI